MGEALDDFFMSSSEKDLLRAGGIAFRDRPGGGNVYVRQLRGTGDALRIEYVGIYEYLLVYYTIILTLITVAMCAILWFWTRPLWRDLEGLKAATARIGAGDFAARARVTHASLLEPIATGFNAMAQRVQSLLRSHRDLEQGVAHELRTPLAQIKFDLELARTSPGGEDVAQRFEAIERDVTDLEELVNELLVLAHLREAPPYVPKDVPAQPLVDELVRRAQDEMRACGRDVRIEAEGELGSSLACDAKYLSRALANVLRNAVRYARSQVRLTVERVGPTTVINVDDDGPGVPSEQRERLFEPFTRVEGSRGRDSGGVGLGLAIVKSVAEWHGGTAHISESPLGGARVSIAW
jgi:signal transduction histidine kinase